MNVSFNVVNHIRYAFSNFKDAISLHLSAQQKKIALVATLIFASIGCYYLAKRCFKNTQMTANKKKEVSLNNKPPLTPKEKDLSSSFTQKVTQKEKELPLSKNPTQPLPAKKEPLPTPQTPVQTKLTLPSTGKQEDTPEAPMNKTQVSTSQASHSPQQMDGDVALSLPNSAPVTKKSDPAAPPPPAIEFLTAIDLVQKNAQGVYKSLPVEIYIEEIGNNLLNSKYEIVRLGDDAILGDMQIQIANDHVRILTLKNNFPETIQQLEEQLIECAIQKSFDLGFKGHVQVFTPSRSTTRCFYMLGFSAPDSMNKHGQTTIKDINEAFEDEEEEILQQEDSAIQENEEAPFKENSNYQQALKILQKDQTAGILPAGDINYKFFNKHWYWKDEEQPKMNRNQEIEKAIRMDRQNKGIPETSGFGLTGRMILPAQESVEAWKEKVIARHLSFEAI